MKIRALTIRNQKSFRDSGRIELEPGFNILIGRNSAGKTAFLEALSGRFDGRPHQSVLSCPREGDQPAPHSAARIEWEIPGDEARRALWRPSRTLTIASDKIQKPDEAAILQHFESFFSQPTIAVAGTITMAKEEFRGIHERSVQTPWEPYEKNAIRVTISQALEPTKYSYVATDEAISEPLAQWARQDTFFFNAQRFSIGEARTMRTEDLAGDARNLPQVLHVLQENPERFERYNSLVSTILPEVKWVSAEISGDSNTSVRLKVWPMPRESERSDLAIPLSECGTGISQILAILYVVLTSRRPRAILIDEPQSFLHPGAVRKLIEVLRQYGSHHQYVISTHAPSLVSAAEPARLINITFDGVESKAEVLSSEEGTSLRAILADVGARPSDVFGAENVLWVEGRTEELCLPQIVREILKVPLMGTQILGVVSTGQFESKHRVTAEAIWEIYGRLSNGGALLPPVAAFIFDREGRRPDEMAKLQEQSRGKIHFLPRRMYENYLLHPGAIAQTLASLLNEAISESIVSNWLSRARTREEYLPPAFRGRTIEEAEWEREVDAARLLATLFNELTDHRATFSKTRDSPAITQWLIQHEPYRFQELTELLRRVIPHSDVVPQAVRRRAV